MDSLHPKKGFAAISVGDKDVGVFFTGFVLTI
jgi:hypothetical protein